MERRTPHRRIAVAATSYGWRDEPSRWRKGSWSLLLPLGLLLLLLCLASASSYGATVYSNDTETASKFAEWTANPSANVTWQPNPPGPVNGSRSVRLSRSSNDVSITRAIATTGYTALSVSYYVATQTLPAGEDLQVQYSTNGGRDWTMLHRYTGTTAWGSHTDGLSSGAADQDDFELRFILSRANSGTYYGYVDDVVVAGTPLTYDLDLSKTGNGTVTVNGISHTLPWSGTFDYGTSITLQAVPDTANHYHFVNWSRDLSGTTNPITFTIDQDTQVRANFALDTYTLTLSGTNGRVDVSGNTHNLPWTGTFSYGTALVLTSDANTGYAFSSWSGDVASIIDPLNVTMTQNLAITANFVVHTPTLTVTGTNGSVQVNGVTTYSLPYTTTYDPSSLVMGLTAVPATGYHFVSWSGSSTSTNATIIAFLWQGNDLAYTANFAPNVRTVTFNGTNGRVSVNGTTHNLPWSGSVTFGSTVNVEALPNTGYHFTGWSGYLTGTTNPTSFTLTADANQTIALGFAINTYALHLTGGNGSVSVNGTPQALPYTGTFNYNASVTLTATAASGYHFVNWTGDVTGSTTPTTFTMTADRTAAVNFAADTYTLSLTGTNGTVEVDGVAHALPWSDATVTAGQSVMLHPVPATGYHFDAWSGGLTGNADPATIVIAGNTSIAVGFAIDSYTVSFSGANGAIVVDSVSHALPWSGSFNYGATPSLQASPDAHYHFTAWSGDLSGTTNPTSLLVDGAKTIAVGIAIDQHDLHLTGQHGTVKVNTVSQSLPYTGTFDYNTVVSVEAVADTHYHFTGWTGDLTGTTNPTSITLDAAKSVAVGFDHDKVKLSVHGSDGTVKVGGVTQTLPYNADYDYGTNLTLEAVADSHHHFGAWSGDLTGTTNPTSVTLEADTSVTATFPIDQHTLRVSGPHGTVKVGGVSQSLPYSGTFDYGTVVNLEAVPSTGYHFGSWTGDVSGAASTSITVNGDKSATAGFAINTYAFHVNGSHGTVTVNDTSHSLSWTGTFDHGTTLNLQAVPATGYHLKSWSGGGLSGSSTIASLTLTAETTVTAEFEINHYVLSVGGSDGSVSVNGSSHDLPWSGTFDHGTTVNLVLTPTAHHHFTSWSGDLTGSTASASLLMESAKTVTAGVEADPCAFTLNGTMGQVKVNGTLHDLPFAGSYGWGSTLALEAVPPTGYALKKWSGDLNGSDNPASLVLSGEKTVTATFWVRQYQLSVAGTGTILVNGKSKYLPFSDSYEFGAAVTIELPSTSCDRFNGWEARSGAINYTNPLTLSMDSDYSFTLLGISPLGIFSDVACDYWAVREIAACYRAGIVSGYTDGTYRPTMEVTRDQMAVYISRALAEGDVNIPAGPSTGTFSDVPTSYWAFKYVEYAASHGIVVGYGDGTYAPTGTVDRGQMAVFVARSMVRPLGDTGMAGYTPPTTPTFSDVGTDFWSYAYVEYLAAQGTASGYVDGTYRPAAAVTRDQMAVYVQRAFGLAR